MQTRAHADTCVCIYIYAYIYIYIGMIMVALRLLGFSGDFLAATNWGIFWCVIWPWYTTRVFWWFFRGNNPWHLDIEMIMVALRLHGLEAGTEPERSGSGAGAERERSGFDDFNVFSWFSCLPLRSRFAPASLPLFFLVFFIFFCSFSSLFLIFWIFEHFFWLFRCFYVFFLELSHFFWKG